LIITYGYPGSIVEFMNIIGPLIGIEQFVRLRHAPASGNA
jgi:hypothetical protein